MRDKITIEELAEKWRIPRSAAYRLVRRPDFPAIKLGKRWLIDPDLAEEWWMEAVS